MESIWLMLAIALFVVILLVAAYFIQKQRIEEFRLLAKSFGTNVTVAAGVWEGPVITFERDGTVFNGEIRRMKYAWDFVVNFELPPSSVHFHIRSKSILASTYVFSRPIPAPSPDWHAVNSPQLSETHVAYSRDPEHLVALLSNSTVIDKLTNYDISSGRFIDIWTEHGRVELMYHADGQGVREKMLDVFETAIVFHDRLKVLTAPQQKI